VCLWRQFHKWLTCEIATEEERVTLSVSSTIWQTGSVVWTKVEKRGSQPECANSILSEWVSLFSPLLMDFQLPLFQFFNMDSQQWLSRPSASDWNLTNGSPCCEASSFSDWAATRFSDSPACSQPLLDYPVSDCVKQLVKSFIIIYIVGSVLLENPD
jgi:hypothetical protein